MEERLGFSDSQFFLNLGLLRTNLTKHLRCSLLFTQCVFESRFTRSSTRDPSPRLRQSGLHLASRKEESSAEREKNGEEKGGEENSVVF